MDSLPDSRAITRDMSRTERDPLKTVWMVGEGLQDLKGSRLTMKKDFETVAALLLSRNRLRSLSVLHNFQSLWILEVAGNSLTSLQGLESLSVLGTLNLAQNPQLQVAHVFQSLHRLELCELVLPWPSASTLENPKEVIQSTALKDGSDTFMTATENGDAVAGDPCPVRLLAVFCLPQTWVIDDVYVTTAERSYASQLFSKFGTIQATPAVTSGKCEDGKKWVPEVVADGPMLDDFKRWRSSVLDSPASASIEEQKQRALYLLRLYVQKASLCSQQPAGQARFRRVSLGVQSGVRSAVPAEVVEAVGELPWSWLLNVESSRVPRILTLVALHAYTRRWLDSDSLFHTLAPLMPNEEMATSLAAHVVAMPHMALVGLLLRIQEVVAAPIVAGRTAEDAVAAEWLLPELVSCAVSSRYNSHDSHEIHDPILEHVRQWQHQEEFSSVAANACCDSRCAFMVDHPIGPADPQILRLLHLLDPSSVFHSLAPSIAEDLCHVFPHLREAVQPDRLHLPGDWGHQEVALARVALSLLMLLGVAPALLEVQHIPFMRLLHAADIPLWQMQALLPQTLPWTENQDLADLVGFQTSSKRPVSASGPGRPAGTANFGPPRPRSAGALGQKKAAQSSVDSCNSSAVSEASPSRIWAPPDPGVSQVGSSVLMCCIDRYSPGRQEDAASFRWTTVLEHSPARAAGQSSWESGRASGRLTLDLSKPSGRGVIDSGSALRDLQWNGHGYWQCSMLLSWTTSMPSDCAKAFLPPSKQVGHRRALRKTAGVSRGFCRLCSDPNTRAWLAAPDLTATQSANSKDLLGSRRLGDPAVAEYRQYDTNRVLEALLYPRTFLQALLVSQGLLVDGFQKGPGLPPPISIEYLRFAKGHGESLQRSLLAVVEDVVGRVRLKDEVFLMDEQTPQKTQTGRYLVKSDDDKSPDTNTETEVFQEEADPVSKGPPASFAEWQRLLRSGVYPRTSPQTLDLKRPRPAQKSWRPISAQPRSRSDVRAQQTPMVRGVQASSLSAWKSPFLLRQGQIQSLSKLPVKEAPKPPQRVLRSMHSSPSLPRC